MPESPIEQEYGEETDVEIGEKVAEESWKGPEKSAEDLGQIMEMARDAPPSRCEQNALVDLAVLGQIGRGQGAECGARRGIAPVSRAPAAAAGQRDN